MFHLKVFIKYASKETINKHYTNHVLRRHCKYIAINVYFKGPIMQKILQISNQSKLKNALLLTKQLLKVSFDLLCMDETSGTNSINLRHNLSHRISKL